MKPNRTALRFLIGASFLVLAIAASENPTQAAEIQISWADNSSNEDGFKIERKSGTSGTFAQLATVGANVTTYRDATVLAGTAYCYRAAAFNSAGTSGYSNEACATLAQTFTLSVAKTGTGAGTVTSSPAGINCGSTCSALFNSGTTVTLTATPATGSTFAGWSGTGCSTGTVTMNGNMTCTATFNASPQQYTLAVNVVKAVSSSGTGNGTVTSSPAGINCGSTCSASFNSGTTVILTATPAAGSTFAGWSGTGCTSGTVTMNGNINCTATFEADASTLTLATKIGIFRPDTGQWFLDRNGNGRWDGCDVDECIDSFGTFEDIPVVSKSKKSTRQIGTFNRSTGRWYLDSNGNGKWDGCAIDSCISSFGSPGDLPISRQVSGLDQSILGTFTGETTTQVNRRTVTQKGVWQFDRNGNGQLDSCSIDDCYQGFGSAGDLPVVGDWSGNGTEDIGVFRPSTGQWLLDYNGDGKLDPPCKKDSCLGPFGLPDDLPVVGDWDGSGKTQIGVFRPGTGEWFLDLNGNGKWDGCAVDICVQSFGQDGDLPVVGKW